MQNYVDEPQRSKFYPLGPRSGLYTDFFLRSVSTRQQENTQMIYRMIKTKTQKNPSQKTKKQFTDLCTRMTDLLDLKSVSPTLL